MSTFQHFLTIGQLSKFSGIHVKALRYYEQISILKPSHVNPDNGYRYYSHSHIPYVALIKLCADYGLPLKDFTNYLLNDQQVDMATIIQQAQEKITQAEKQLQTDKHYLNTLYQQLQLSQEMDKTQHFHLDQGNEDYVLFPFDGDMLSAAYYKQVRQSLADLETAQLEYDNRLGCYYVYQDQKVQQYLAVKVKECLDSQPLPSICLNDQHIHAEHIHQDQITDKLHQLHTDSQLNHFLILETFESPYHLSQPHLELRYLLKN